MDMEDHALPNNSLPQYLTLEKLKEDYLKYGLLSRLAKRYGVTLKSLFDALDNYGLTLKEMDRERELSIILNEYRNILGKLGHHPSRAEMLRRIKWKELLRRISLRYGSLTNFKKIHGYEDNTAGLRNQRAVTVYKDYKFLGSLDRVSKKYNISRERVRQILKIGSSLGLFKYPPETQKSAFDITPERLRKDYLLYGSRRGMARHYGIDTKDIADLMTKYGLSSEKLRHEIIRRRILERYNKIVARLGHHPTATELYQTRSERVFCNTIGRIYGSMDNFRKAYGYPIPEKGSIKFARIRQESSKVAREQILNLLRTKSKAGVLEISNALTIDRETVRKHILKLHEEGAANRTTKGRFHYYFIKNMDIAANEEERPESEVLKSAINPKDKVFIDELSKLYIRYGNMDIVAKKLQKAKPFVLNKLDEIIKSKALFPINTRKAFILALRIKGFCDKHPSTFKASKRFGLHEVVINRYLKYGSQADLFERPVLSGKKKRYSAIRTFIQQDMYSRKNIRVILAVKKDFDASGSCEKAARMHGVSRERIRQILTTGSDLGLFEYPPKKELLFSITKEDLYNGLLRCKGMYKLSKLYKVSANEIKRAMETHGISMEAIHLELGRTKALDEYQDLVSKLGHHPSTTEIKLRHPYLLRNIKRGWGSVYEFRKTYDFPSPKIGPPEKTSSA